MNDAKYSEDKVQFWEDIYLADDAGWDLCGPTPVFKAVAKDLEPGKVCIVGCGRGYDAVMFARKGFEVTVVDFAPVAIEAVRILAKDFNVSINTVQADIFALGTNHANFFDYIIEQTCFCAINPGRRKEYEIVMHNILKQGGRIIGLWFPLDKKMEEGGPPYGTTIEEVKAIFMERWKTEKEEFPELSVSPRRGREKLIIFKKC